MFGSSLTNVSSQWPLAAPVSSWQGVSTYAQHSTYHQFHDPSNMAPGRHHPTRPLPAQPPPNLQSRPTQKHVQPAQRVSQAKLSSLLDWLEYRDDNTDKQTQATLPANPYFSPQAVAQNLHPSPLPSRPADHGTSFNPQASSFQPAQTTQSRYNLRSKLDGERRLYAHRSADHAVQSIEPHEPVSNTAHSTTPWRRGGKRQSTPYRTTPARDETARPVTPPPEPAVSRVYLSRTQTPPQTLLQPQKLLIVLDLNGTLCVRERGVSFHMTKRPGVEPFLKYLFDNHIVMICTSATGRNAGLMADNLLTKAQYKQLVTIRARDSFDLTPKQYNAKVQIYKNLEDIWNDPLIALATPADQQPWSMTNTVLIDDSILKAKAQPHNLLQVPEFELDMTTGKKSVKQTMRAREEKIMQSVQAKLEVLKYQVNVASLIRLWQSGEREVPSVIDGLVDQATQLLLKDDDDEEAAAAEGAAENYPTPTSLETTPSQEPEKDNYETPEQVELVFRGRQNASKATDSYSKTLRSVLKSSEAQAAVATKPTRHVGNVSAGDSGKRNAQRGASPVMEQDFEWLKK